MKTNLTFQSSKPNWLTMPIVRTCGFETAAFTKDFLDRMATPLTQGHCHDYQVINSTRLDDTMKLLELNDNLMKLVYLPVGFSTVWDGRRPSSPGQGHRPTTLCDLSSLCGFHLMYGRKCTAIPEVCYFHANALEFSKSWFSWLCNEWMCLYDM